MKLLLVYSLFASAVASDGTVITDSGVCSLANGHPETGGYYIVGVNGYQTDTGSPNPKTGGNPVYAHEDPDDPSSYGDWGQVADDYTWTKNPDRPYANAMPKGCTPSMFSNCGSYGDTTSVMYVHICSRMRFAYPADSGSTVWKMKDNETFQACDFTDAQQIAESGTLPSGKKYVDYPFDVGTMDTTYYFASQNGCDAGQKVAIRPQAEYTSIYDQCLSMGAGSNKVQHCDCDSKIKPHTNTEVCLTGFIDGCRAQEPDDRSCCPDNSTLSGRDYVNGGNCIPKNKKDDFMKEAKELHDTCVIDSANKVQCDGYKEGRGTQDLRTLPGGVCPWKTQGSMWNPATYVAENTIDDTYDGNETVFDPLCNSWYMIAHCTDLEDGNEVGAGFTGDTLTKIQEDVTEDTCGQSQILAAYKMYLADLKKAAKATDSDSFTAVASIGLTLALLA
jgi:hypothetical protein